MAAAIPLALAAARGSEELLLPAKGDPASLACRVVRVEPVSKGIEASIVTVEVRNPGRVRAEPIRFRIRPRASGRGDAVPPRIVCRMPDPVEGRQGRSAAPGGTETYSLAVPAPAKSLMGATFRVEAASFFEGEARQEAPVEIEGIAVNRVVDEGGAPVHETTARLRNRTDREVDAIFLATCAEPEGARLLLSRRLAPGESAAWTFREAPLALHEASAPSVTGVAVRRMKLVDWSFVVRDGRAEGARILAAAWERWVRWEEPFPLVRGRFALRLARGGAAASPIAVAGRFTLHPDGAVATAPEGDVDPGTARALVAAIEEAFAHLRRPAAAAVIASAAPSLLEQGLRTRIRCEAPPSGERGPPFVYRIEAGVLRGWEDPASPDAIREEWTTEAAGERYLVTARDLFQTALAGGESPCDSRRWSHATVAGWIAPARFSRAARYGAGGADETVVEFADLSFEGGCGTPESRADAPQTLRDAWESAYRYPSEPVLLRARFLLENPGTDALWQGERRVSGRLRLVDFTGMREAGTGWRRAEFEIEGELPDRKREDLAALVEDRLRIWASRDFGGREPFDVAFRGARIVPRAGEPDLFDVSNGPCSRIAVREGRVREWDGPGVTGGILEFGRAGNALVHASLRNGPSLVTARHEDLGGGWVVPFDFRFERVFGPDWGPETLLLSDLRIEPCGGE